MCDGGSILKGLRLCGIFNRSRFQNSMFDKYCWVVGKCEDYESGPFVPFSKDKVILKATGIENTVSK